jgi:hypothetical protein
VPLDRRSQHENAMEVVTPRERLACREEHLVFAVLVVVDESADWQEAECSPECFEAENEGYSGQFVHRWDSHSEACPVMDWPERLVLAWLVLIAVAVAVAD